MTFALSKVLVFLVCILSISVFGYILGRVTIKGVSLGTAGVFIMALIFGALSNVVVLDGQQILRLDSSALKVVEQLGLILFVASVGLIAGPTFFSNLKKNFKSYILLGFVIIVAGGVAALGCLYVAGFLEGAEGLHGKELVAMICGLFSGALTSTPAFSAAQEAAGEAEALVSAGYGISYLFGVVGVVLFIQLIPKITKVSMTAERSKLMVADTSSDKQKKEGARFIEIDDFGIMPLALTAVLGAFLGSMNIGGFFSLGTTGGVLVMALVIGFIGHIGPFQLMPKATALKVFREFGLMLFLIGAGVPGGVNFIANVKAIYFVYGMVMTIVPLIVGYLFAKYVLKLALLNNLGSITGGMTSTPALGTLIKVSETEAVASAYAATYPIALIAVVLVSKVLFLFA